jgi:hypothetical protein
MQAGQEESWSKTTKHCNFITSFEYIGFLMENFIVGTEVKASCTQMEEWQSRNVINVVWPSI